MNVHFSNNFLWSYIGIGLSLFIIGLSSFRMLNLIEEDTSLALGIPLLSGIIIGLIYANTLNWLKYFRIRKGIALLLLSTVLIYITCLGIFFGFYQMFPEYSMLYLVLIGIIILINFLFRFLLKAPTKKGRLLMDDIKALELYLRKIEKPINLDQLLPYIVVLEDIRSFFKKNSIDKFEDGKIKSNLMTLNNSKNQTLDKCLIFLLHYFSEAILSNPSNQ